MTIYEAIKDKYPEITTVDRLFSVNKDILAVKVKYGENAFIVSRYGYNKNYSVKTNKLVVENFDGTRTVEMDVNEEFLAFEIVDKDKGVINHFIISGATPVHMYLSDDKEESKPVSVEFLKKSDCTAEELYAIYESGGEIEAFNDTDDFQRFYGLKDNETFAEGPRFLDHDKMAVKVGHLHEELDELEKAWANGDLAEAADALIDLVYVANGAMNLCNLPASVLWRDVQNSNMIGKERVKSLDNATKRGSTFDVKKTKDWVGPRGSELIEVYRRWCNK